MSCLYDLQITTRDAWVAELQLRDAGGNHRADFSLLSPSQKRGLFDLRNFIRHYAGEGQEAAHVAEIGVCIADAVLGTDIIAVLELSEWERTLRIQLPGATDPNDHLAAALVRPRMAASRPDSPVRPRHRRPLCVGCISGSARR